MGVGVKGTGCRVQGAEFRVPALSRDYVHGARAASLCKQCINSIKIPKLLYLPRIIKIVTIIT